MKYFATIGKYNLSIIESATSHMLKITDKNDDSIIKEIEKSSLVECMKLAENNYNVPSQKWKKT